MENTMLEAQKIPIEYTGSKLADIQQNKQGSNSMFTHE
jgi:hypothetical protein